MDRRRQPPCRRCRRRRRPKEDFIEVDYAGGIRVIPRTTTTRDAEREKTRECRISK